MKQPIIQTVMGKYLLLINDEKIIPCNGRCMAHQSKPCEDCGKYQGRTVIAHLPLSDSKTLEGVPLLPELEDNKIDVLLDKFLIERGEHPTRVRNPIYGEERDLAKKCYQSATKVYGEEDLRKIAQAAFVVKSNNENIIEDFDKWFSNRIKSLKTSNYPKWFIPETEDVFTNNSEKYIHSTGAEGNYSTHDKEIKKTRNQQEQTVLVGTYEY